MRGPRINKYGLARCRGNGYDILYLIAFQTWDLNLAVFAGRYAIIFRTAYLRGFYLECDSEHRLRHIRPGFSVLLYAGYVDESLSRRIEAESLGRVTFKPFKTKELAAAIRDRLSLGTKPTRPVLF
jgi:hypothetical protein